MNFALYSCDWTGLSIQFKKILLFTMIVNNTENMKLQISPKKIVNLEMFANVCIKQNIYFLIVLQLKCIKHFLNNDSKMYNI